MPKGREDAHPPVADLVTEPLNHDGAIVGYSAGTRGLLVEVLDKIGCGERIERVMLHEPFGRHLADRTLDGLDQRPRIVVCRAKSRLRQFRRIGGAEIADFADERAERATQLQRTTRAVAVPERHLAGLPGCWTDGHSFEGDVLDPPG